MIFPKLKSKNKTRGAPYEREPEYGNEDGINSVEISQPIDESSQFETPPIISKVSGLKELIDWEEQSSERLDSRVLTKNKSPTTLEHTKQVVMCWDLAKRTGFQTRKEV